MQFVNLGRTGLKVSRVCLGTMTYGTSKWREWVLDEEPSRVLIKQALELATQRREKMALEKIERLGQQMQFGSDNERIWAVIELGNLADKDEQDEAFGYLVWRASRETGDDNERMWAHISLAKFVTNDSLRSSFLKWFESARDTLLRILLYYAQHPEMMSPVGLSAISTLNAASCIKTRMTKCANSQP